MSSNMIAPECWFASGARAHSRPRCNRFWRAMITVPRSGRRVAFMRWRRSRRNPWQSDMQTSTAPSLSSTRRSTLLRVAGWLVAAVVIVYVGKNLGDGLLELREQPMPDNPRWGMIALSGALFLAAHAVLVQTWRSVLA